MAVVFSLLPFQKYYIKREVWSGRVVGSARMEGWRMTGSAPSALDVDFWATIITTVRGPGREGAAAARRAGFWRIPKSRGFVRA